MARGAEGFSRLWGYLVSDSASRPDLLTDQARTWLKEHHQAVLVTLRRDGSAQSSNIAFSFDGQVARISVTADRVKTRNIRRDPRVVLHVLGDTFWQYAAVQASATASEVSSQPGDSVGRDLLDIYQDIAGPHPDPDDFFRAMTGERRLVLTLIPVRVMALNIS
jgi:PPOX class probable F420-dependent enzyme